MLDAVDVGEVPEADIQRLSSRRAKRKIGRPQSLTCRQIFHRLVGAHGYEKTEKAYKRLCELLNRARRGRHISMNAIRDNGGDYRIQASGYEDSDQFMRVIRIQASASGWIGSKARRISSYSPARPLAWLRISEASSGRMTCR